MLLFIWFPGPGNGTSQSFSFLPVLLLCYFFVHARTTNCLHLAICLKQSPQCPCFIRFLNLSGTWKKAWACCYSSVNSFRQEPAQSYINCSLIKIQPHNWDREEETDNLKSKEEWKTLEEKESSVFTLFLSQNCILYGFQQGVHSCICEQC